MTSGIEVESGSIYREKRLGLERQELSVGEGVSLKGGLTLIDKELRARLGKSIESEFQHSGGKTKSEALPPYKSSLTFSSTVKKVETEMPHPQSQYMSSGEFNFGPNPVNNLYIKGFENIHEDSKEYYTTNPGSKITTPNQTGLETEMQETFFGSLKDVVAVIFAQIQEHVSAPTEPTLQRLMEDKTHLAASKSSVLKGMNRSKIEDLLAKHDLLLARMDEQLGDQMQKPNLLKRLLIELLMFLDLQVLGMSKVRKLFHDNKHFSTLNTPSTIGKGEILEHLNCVIIFGI